MTKPRKPIRIKRRGPDMPAWHKRDEPTTNVASRERSATRQVKKDIRVDEAKMYGNARDWADKRKKEGDER